MNIKKAEVKLLPRLYTAACSHIGPYSELCSAYDKLVKWAAPKGLLDDQAVMLAVYHDDPYKVPATQLRSDACLVVDPDNVIEGDVHPYKVSGGKYLIVSAELTMSEFGDVWAKAYEVLKEKGQACDTRDHYEVYQNSPEMNADAIYLIDICIPVK